MPDTLAGPYADMAAAQRAYNQRQEADREQRRAGPAPARGIRAPLAASGIEPRRINHPGVLESMVPVWGSGKEALADLEDGDYVGAAINTGLAASDVFLAKAVVGGLMKGGLKTAAPYVWRNAPRKGQSARQWLGDQGFAQRGQPMHHWLFEQRSSVPDWIKNQPPFVMPMKDAVEHGRIHGRYTVDGVKLPRYNAAERVWRGTPPWAKAAVVSSTGHAGEAVEQYVRPDAADDAGRRQP